MNLCENRYGWGNMFCYHAWVTYHEWVYREVCASADDPGYCTGMGLDRCRV